MGAIREEQGFVYVGGKRLRRGFTTGSCAAAASKAAVQMLLSGSRVEYVDLVTPKGIPIHVPVEDISVSPDSVSCAVRKDGGDDADDTNGALVYAKVSRKASEGIDVDGGVGVGRVTRRGLDQPVGNAAINRVPRSMIKEAVEDVCGAYGHTGGISVEISVPEGERIAERTFNSRLGIVGGISILGTSGIVEPMSETALLGSIKAEMKVFMAPGGSISSPSPGTTGRTSSPRIRTWRGSSRWNAAISSGTSWTWLSNWAPKGSSWSAIWGSWSNWPEA